MSDYSSNQEDHHEHLVRVARHMARDDLHATRRNLDLAEVQMKRLGDGPASLYDAQFVEIDQRPAVVAAAFVQIRVALAAIEGCIPQGDD